MAENPFCKLSAISFQLKRTRGFKPLVTSYSVKLNLRACHSEPQCSGGEESLSRSAKTGFFVASLLRLTLIKTTMTDYEELELGWYPALTPNPQTLAPLDHFCLFQPGDLLPGIP